MNTVFKYNTQKLYSSSNVNCSFLMETGPKLIIYSDDSLAIRKKNPRREIFPLFACAVIIATSL